MEKTPENIRATRGRLGWTQERAATMLGYTGKNATNQYAKMERGARNMPDKVWKLMCALASIKMLDRRRASSVGSNVPRP